MLRFADLWARGGWGRVGGSVDDERVAKVVAVIRPTEVRELTAEGESYEAARNTVREQVPEGWQVISFRTVKD